MIIDAHYHLDERMETIDRVLGQMYHHGIDKIALIPTMVDPLMVDAISEKLGALVRSMLMGKWHNLGRHLYRTTVSVDGRYKLFLRSYPIYSEPENESVARSVRAHPDKFLGWIFVNPSAANAINEIERWIAQPGWIGVKAHPFMHRYPVSMLDAAAAYCSDRDWPLLVHLGGDYERGNFRYLPDRHPNLQIIYAHAGLPFYAELWEYAKTKKKVYVDLSSGYLNESLRLNAVRALGAERCLYGTDGPYGYRDADGLYDHGRILKEILGWSVSDADKELITGGNFRRITCG